jgi:hypothetical protein
MATTSGWEWRGFGRHFKTKTALEYFRAAPKSIQRSGETVTVAAHAA